jgi:hypothetical protein
MLAYRQAFASSVVKKYLTLFKHKWGRCVLHQNIAFNRLFVGYHAILPMRDASPPFVLEFESDEPSSSARQRLHISHAHDVGKHTGCCHIGAGTITLNEHGVFVVALGGEQ